MGDVLIILGGFLAGALGGALGIGGGVVMVPLLSIGFGFGERLAQGTSLAAILPIALVGAWTHFRRGNVQVRPGLWMGLAGAPLAAAGALLAQQVPGPLLARVFGAFMIVAAIRIWPYWGLRAAAPGG